MLTAFEGRRGAELAKPSPGRSVLSETISVGAENVVEVTSGPIRPRQPPSAAHAQSRKGVRDGVAGWEGDVSSDSTTRRRRVRRCEVPATEDLRERHPSSVATGRQRPCEEENRSRRFRSSRNLMRTWHLSHGRLIRVSLSRLCSCPCPCLLEILTRARSADWSSSPNLHQMTRQGGRRGPRRTNAAGRDQVQGADRDGGGHPRVATRVPEHLAHPKTRVASRSKRRSQPRRQPSEPPDPKTSPPPLRSSQEHMKT